MTNLNRYRLKRQTERAGSLELMIECLADLDETIDELFADVEKSGDTRALEDLCPYFGVIWPSARALANHLALGGIRPGERILEIGCGLALPSLVASRLGAIATAVDYHPEVELFLARNLALNSPISIAYHRLDWTVTDSSLGAYERIVGSDILYERQQPARVASFIDAHLTQCGVATITDPARPYLQPFADEMRARGFHCETSVRDEIFLLELTRRKKMD